MAYIQKMILKRTLELKIKFVYLLVCLSLIHIHSRNPKRHLRTPPTAVASFVLELFSPVLLKVETFPKQKQRLVERATRLRTPMLLESCFFQSGPYESMRSSLSVFLPRSKRDLDRVQAAVACTWLRCECIGSSENS